MSTESSAARQATNDSPSSAASCYAGRHEPADEDEAFEIMNLVDPVLRTSNSGAVLAAVNCFLLLTKNMPDMRYQVPPLMLCYGRWCYHSSRR